MGGMGATRGWTMRETFTPLQVVGPSSAPRAGLEVVVWSCCCQTPDGRIWSITAVHWAPARAACASQLMSTLDLTFNHSV